jgi:hypothetical protein
MAAAVGGHMTCGADHCTPSGHGVGWRRAGDADEGTMKT